MLSAFGRRAYFPKGILSQSAEAKEKAHRFNATIGIATEGGRPMSLPSITEQLGDVTIADAVTYAPAGRPARTAERWREKLLAENPSLRDRSFGEPMVTNAITHGSALAGELFLDPGDCRADARQALGQLPASTYEVQLGAKIATFPFYTDAGDGLNTEAFAQRASRSTPTDHDKLVVLLNFPNNPTGYMPTPAEGDALAAALDAQAANAAHGSSCSVDDAYFGLFYHLGGSR